MPDPMSRDPEVVARLRERYTSEPVPPCRVCGEPLTIARMGGGALTEYACGSEDARQSVYRSNGSGETHYSRSRWTQPKHGDLDVLALLDYVEALHAAGYRVVADREPCRHDARWFERFTSWVIRVHAQQDAAPTEEGDTTR